MSCVVETEIIIEATPEEIWSVLVDFEQYSEWNPIILSASGIAEKGERLQLSIFSAGKKMKFKPKVIVAEQAKVLEWLGHLGFPGIFDGLHTFELVAVTAKTTKILQRESFTGILTSFARRMSASICADFKRSNQAIADRVISIYYP